MERALHPRLAASRKEPDLLAYGMSGNGTWAHLAGEIVATLEADLKTALGDPAVQATLEKTGATPVGSSSKEFDAFMRARKRRNGSQC